MGTEISERENDPSVRSYYHREPRWLIRSTPVADTGPSARAPFYFFFDHFDTTRGLVLWVVANVALGQLGERSHIVASIHGWVVVITCFYLAMSSKRLVIVLATMGYAAMCDTFWRMTDAGVPWESSKYLVLGMCGIILIRWIGRPKSGYCTAIMILLLPGLVEGAEVLGIGNLKGTFGFVLLGLYVLAISSMVTRRLRCTWPDLRTVLWAMIGPAAAVASITATSVSKLTVESFQSIQSNDAAAGNFGANQVGAILGLGALFALYLALQDNNWAVRALALSLSLWFVAQSAITLSRGGLAATAIALLVATPQIILHDRLGLRLLLTITLVGLVAGVVLLPRLDHFTNGAVNRRFHDTNTTERGALAGVDMRLFTEHPVFGVGVGVSDKAHAGVEAGGLAVASHTEWTRLLAEHGIFGLAVMACMLGLFIEAFRRQNNWFGRAWTTGLVGWVVADLTVASTRNCMNVFVFALAMLAVDDRIREDIPDVDTEVFGDPDLFTLEDPEPEPPTAAEEAESAETREARRQVMRRLQRAYRTHTNPNTGSAITYEPDPPEPPGS